MAASRAARGACDAERGEHDLDDAGDGDHIDSIAGFDLVRGVAAALRVAGPPLDPSCMKATEEKPAEALTQSSQLTLWEKPPWTDTWCHRKCVSASCSADRIPDHAPNRAARGAADAVR